MALSYVHLSLVQLWICCRYNVVNSRTYLVYCYTFEDGSEYVGLTSAGLKKRHLWHVAGLSTVGKLVTLGLEYRHNVLHDGLSLEEARCLEINEILSRREAGVELLNQTTGGEVGGYGLVSRWPTMEACLDVAKQFRSKWAWHRSHQASFSMAYKNGWISNISALLGWTEYKSKWSSKESCLNAARLFNGIHSWQRGSKGSYAAAKSNGWFDDIITILGWVRRKAKWPTMEACLEDSLRFDKIWDWQRGKGACSYARDNGWLDEICRIRGWKRRAPRVMAQEECFATSAGFNSIFEWQKGSPGSYAYAKRRGWLEGIVKARGWLKWSGRTFWTKESCYESAKRFKNIAEWQKKSRGSYKFAYRHGLVEDVAKFYI